jgi:hypothetical protein
VKTHGKIEENRLTFLTHVAATEEPTFAPPNPQSAFLGRGLEFGRGHFFLVSVGVYPIGKILCHFKTTRHV